MGIKRSFFSNLYSLPGIFLFLLKSLKVQKSFIKKNVHPKIVSILKTNDGSVTPADVEKITNYYALGVPAILGEAFCVLRGKPLQDSERHCLSFLGGISGLLDDLFDDPGKEVLHLKKFINQPEELNPANCYEKLLLHFYSLGLYHSTTPEKLITEANKIFDAQLKSTGQTTQNFSAEQLKELTRLKGGTSFIFYRLCLETSMGNEEKEFFYSLGGLMQLGNDIFDVWEDLQEKIHTIATSTNTIEDLRFYFTNELINCYRQISKLSYDRNNKIQFLKIITLALARVFVCLDQFENLEKLTNNKFVPANYTRTQLICDMQKPRNQVLAIKYYLSFDLRSFLS